MEPGKLYGRRKGKPISPSRRRIVERALPRLALDLSQPCTDAAALFDRPVGRVHLEIGIESLTEIEEKGEKIKHFQY